MKKVLIYENRKTNPMIWDVSTQELAKSAALDLFKYLDETWEVYTDLVELQQPEKPELTLEQIELLPDGRLKNLAKGQHEEYTKNLSDYQRLQKQKTLYNKCKEGNAEAAIKLLKARQTYEYEGWTICDVISK